MRAVRGIRKPLVRKPQSRQDIAAKAGEPSETTQGPCYRPICGGTMRLCDDLYFQCDLCRITIDKGLYLAWLQGEADLEANDDYSFFDHPDYDDVYDEEGDWVRCTNFGCDAVIKYRSDNQYVCPRCDEVIPRAEFFDHIGAEPLGEKCLTCDEKYPSCKEFCVVYGHD